MAAVRTLKSSRDFHRVRSTGSRARSDGITVWRSAGAGDGPTRVGLAARSRSAVERNRIRRRVRAAWQELEAPAGSDVVIGADPRTLGLEFQELVTHLRSAVTRAGGAE